MVNIEVPAGEVWSFFHRNIERLKTETVVIAENTETEYAVYLTEKNGMPYLSACKGDKPFEYSEGCVSPTDCESTAKKMYVNYLFPIQVKDESAVTDNGELEEDYPLTRQDMEDAIYERDDELELALGDFLDVVLDYNSKVDPLSHFGRETFFAILEDFLTILAEDYGELIYRPSIITDEETHDEVYCEYPYNTEIEDDAYYVPDDDETEESDTSLDIDEFLKQEEERNNWDEYEDDEDDGK